MDLKGLAGFNIADKLKLFQNKLGQETNNEKNSSSNTLLEGMGKEISYSGLDRSLLTTQNQQKLEQLNSGEITEDSVEDDSNTKDDSGDTTPGLGGDVAVPAYKTQQEFIDWMDSLADGENNGTIGEEDIQAAIDYFKDLGVSEVLIGEKLYKLYTDENGEGVQTDDEASIVLTKGGNVTTGKGDDIVIAYGVNNIETGAGDDSLYLSGAGRNGYIDEGGIVNTGEGNDKVSINTDTFLYVNTGEGDDVIDAFSGQNGITAGDGEDVINLYGNENKVNVGAGNDIVSFYGDDNIAHGGDGDDTFYMYDNGTTDGEGKIYNNNRAMGEEGSDTYYSYTEDNQLYGGEGADTYINAGDTDEAAFKAQINDKAGTTETEEETSECSGSGGSGKCGKSIIKSEKQSVLTSHKLGNMSTNPISITVMLLKANGIEVPDGIDTQSELKAFLAGLFGTEAFDELPEDIQNEIRAYLGLPMTQDGEIVETEGSEGIPCSFIQEGLANVGIEVPADVDTAEEWKAFLTDFAQTDEFTALPAEQQKAINEYLGVAKTETATVAETDGATTTSTSADETSTEAIVRSEKAPIKATKIRR